MDIDAFYGIFTANLCLGRLFKEITDSQCCYIHITIEGKMRV